MPIMLIETGIEFFAAGACIARIEQTGRHEIIIFSFQSTFKGEINTDVLSRSTWLQWLIQQIHSFCIDH